LFKSPRDFLNQTRSPKHKSRIHFLLLKA
jgi:hypothetical protein